MGTSNTLCEASLQPRYGKIDLGLEERGSKKKKNYFNQSPYSNIPVFRSDELKTVWAHVWVDRSREVLIPVRRILQCKEMHTGWAPGQLILHQVSADLVPGHLVLYPISWSCARSADLYQGCWSCASANPADLVPGQLAWCLVSWSFALCCQVGSETKFITSNLFII